MKVKACPSFPVSIFIAGDCAQAKAVVQEYCDAVGLCATVSATDYVYTEGVESGVVVGLINYPRFPSTRERIFETAKCLGLEMMRLLGQQSFSIQTPVETTWFSIREADLAAIAQTQGEATNE